MRFNFELSDITLENIGTWPAPIKVACLILVFIVTLFLGYWFDIRPQLAEVDQLEQKQVELTRDFEIKHQLAANLSVYKQQLKSIKSSFGKMLKQLPGTTEVPGLLEDISKTGLASGLTFELFKPLPEVKQDFYAELPIFIEVKGTYHELADFISQVVALDRIVTLHNITIERASARQGAQPPSAAGKQALSNELIMDITAKTYRYNEGQET